VQNGGKDLDEGLRVLQEAVDEFPIVEAHYHLGKAQLLKNQADDAVEQFDRGIELINKAKRDKKPYDQSYEKLLKEGRDAATKVAAAAAPVGSVR
jgi:hypothetical protein